MNKLSYSFVLLTSLLFITCSRGVEDNPMLGKLPGISKSYIHEIEEIKIKIEENTNLNKAFELAKELEIKEEEASAAIKKYMALQKKPFLLPFEQLADKDKFVIKEIKVREARFDDLKIEALTEIIVQYDYEYFTYLRFLDKDNKPIEGWAVLMSPRNNEAGKEVIFTGYYQRMNKLIDAVKVEIRTRDEYNNNR